MHIEQGYHRISEDVAANFTRVQKDVRLLEETIEM